MENPPTSHAAIPEGDAEGIDPRIHCSSCAAVCCRLTVVLMPDDHVPERLIAYDAHGLRTMAKAEDGWCVALDRDTNRCSIYATRPEICRKYAMGGPSCRDEREKWYGAAKPAPTRSR